MPHFKNEMSHDVLMETPKVYVMVGRTGVRVRNPVVLPVSSHHDYPPVSSLLE